MDSLESHRILLEELRHDSATWHRITFEKIADADGNWHDTNNVTRYGVLRALQLDLRLEDEDLVRFILGEEIKARSVYPLSNVLWAHELAVYLLATYRRAADLPLFWQAKIASFDSFCGIPEQYLFWIGGIDALHSVVDPNLGEVEHQQFFCEHLSQYSNPTPVALREWWQTQQKSYPTSLEEEAPEQRYNAAVRLQAETEASFWLDEWEAEVRAAPTYPTLRHLVYLRGKRNQNSHAYSLAMLQQNTTMYKENVFTKVWTHQNISEYATKIGLYSIAWEHLNTMLEISTNEQTEKKTYARIISAGFFDLAIAAFPSHYTSNRDIAESSYQKALDLETEAGFFPLDTLRKAERAALTVGDIASAVYYAAKAKAEDERLAAMRTTGRGT